MRSRVRVSQRPPGFTKATKKIWLPFLRPGKPLAQTGVEIGDSQSEACHGVVVQSTPKPGGTGKILRMSCAATRSRAVRQVKLMENIGMAKFYYVYLLVDVATESHRYTGVTEDLTARLAKHNAGKVPHTSKFKLWKVEAYFAFETKEKAAGFETYLKTGSGHAFANRHF